MRVLLLSCNTGEGHNSTGKAVMEVLQSRGVQCQMKDVLACVSPKFSEFICSWHVRLYRYGPVIFDTAYKAMDRAPGDPDEALPVYDLLALGTDKLYEAIADGDYDAIVCVHVFSGMMMTELRRKNKVMLPCFFVNTDYSCVPLTEQCKMDGYFIPAASLIPEFVSKGLTRDRLIPTGIPVRQAFYTKKPRMQARTELSLQESAFVVLLMCGSMGCGPMRKLAKKLTEQMPEDGKLVTICGNNEKLFQTLSEIQDPRLQVLGYCTKVSDYMDAADLIVTKPGGLSSTEAACKHLPIVFIHSVGGCEEKNFSMFLQNGFALGSRDPEEVVRCVCRLRDNPEQRAQMQQRLEQAFCQNSACLIADHVMEAAEQFLQNRVFSI